MSSEHRQFLVEGHAPAKVNPDWAEPAGPVSELERMSRSLRVMSLGQVEYPDGLTLQQAFRDARVKGLVEDQLFLLEHPPILTLGRGAARENLLWDEDQLREAGFAVFETDRGGDVTYHGPGQIVGYPIVNLAPDRKDVRRYVRDLEEVLIRTLDAFGIVAHREARWPGVWVGSDEKGDLRKIAALGVHISRWVTTHGFALNLNPDLRHFESIVPCGIHEAGVTSMEHELGHVPARDSIERQLGEHFAHVFGAVLNEPGVVQRTVAVFPARWRSGRAELLLLKRTAERGGFWQPVTGRVEADEGLQQAATRELLEETGIPATARALDYEHAFVWSGASQSNVVTLPILMVETAFVASCDGAAVQLSAEHEEHVWLPLEEALVRLPFEGLRQGAKRAARSLS